MKIIGIDIFSYDIVYSYGEYVMSHGRAQTFEPSLVVRLRTDTPHVGWSETSPHGGTYLPAFYAGELAALKILGGAVLGRDPRELLGIQATMSSTLMGGMAAKSAIDIACWDLLGKASDLSVSALLGGRLQQSVRLLEALPVGLPAAMAEAAKAALIRGTQAIQVKVGNDPYQDAERVAAVVDAIGDGYGEHRIVIADANGGWNLQQALIAARELAGHRIFLEQPCRSLENCAEVRQHSDLPMILDECVITIEDLVAARTRAGSGGVSIKPGRIGGLTPARLMRDTAVELGMTVTVDETWGGGLATAALSHLSASTAPDSFLAVPYFTEWTHPDIARGPRQLPDGSGEVPTTAGLGVHVDTALLGEPLLTLA